METSDTEVEQSLQDSVSNFLFGEEGAEGQEAQAEEVELPHEEDEDAVESEIEAKLEDEDTPEAETEFVEMEVDGKLYEVPVELKDKLMFQQDYTQKTQEVAEQRKTLEVVRSETELKAKQYEFAQSVWPDLLEAQQQEAVAKQYQDYLRENIDNLSAVEIEKLRMASSDAKNKAQEIAQEIQRKQQETQQAHEQSLQELVEKGTEVLKQRIPNWGPEAQRAVRNHVLSKGFTEEEASTILDPRYAEIAWEASQYRALRDGATPAVKKVQAAPKLKPKARDPKGRFVSEKNKLQKTLKSPKLSDADKAQAIADSIGII